ncbi:MAG: ATPase [Paracoccaceae bacterium]
MLYKTAREWTNSRQKRVSLFGMSGLGKTHLSNLLRESGDWFHYSVDYRIGTRYMGEHIVDNFKREAIRNPFLRELLLSDSIYIASNLTFKNLSPLSSYLGKPGNPDKGGITFDEYIRRQRLHRDAEIAATRDVAFFIERARHIYGYNNFVCDTSGSICEIVTPEDPNDPVMSTLAASTLPVWIRGSERHTTELLERFDKHPKPMYYDEDFLRNTWNDYLAKNGLTESEVDPDAFIRWGFQALIEHRLPAYEAMARHWAVTVEAADVARVRDEADFEEMIAGVLPDV